MEEELSSAEQKILLGIARQAIENELSGKGSSLPPREERLLNFKNGCFVTLKNQQELRGCIGNFQSSLPLFKEVEEMAVAAAFKDPRFYPLEVHELKDISIEISVLSPLHKIVSIDEIEVGKHGIYLEKDFFRGVLLPQVALEYHWDKETFLLQTCLKAGLPAQAWQDGDTDIYIFSAQIFSESTIA
ncbi:MAG: AmmeMemoRadiSam system protein A [Desulfuromonadaceae bacterium]|nr:AmmeMemoRadiSam system protein A [Desulfuromonadaceae bacterium]